MTFEEKVKNIKYRLNNNNFKLDQEDIFIIFNSNELFNLLLSKMCINKDAVTDYTWDIINTRMPKLFELSKIDLVNLLSNFFNLSLSANKSNLYSFDYNLFNEYFNMFNVDDEMSRIIFYNITKYISENKDVNITKIYNDSKNLDFMINLLLDNKRFDIISNFVFKERDEWDYLKLSPSTIAKFNKLYPFNEYKVPEFVNHLSNTDDYLKYYSLNDLIKYYSSFKDPKIKQMILDKIYSTDSLVNYPILKVSHLFNYDENFEMDLFKKGCFLYADNLILDNDLSLKEVEDKILEVLINNDLNEESFPVGDSIKYRNPIIKKYMIDHGYIYPLISTHSLNNEDIERIVREIKNNNPVYDKFVTTISCEINDIPSKIYKAIVDSNKLEKLSNIYVSSIDREHYSSFCKMLEKYPNIKIYYDEDLDSKMIKLLLKRKTFGPIIDVFYMLDNQDIVIDYLVENNNYYLANELLNSDPRAVFSNKRLLSYYLYDDILVETTINYLQACEDLDYLYSDGMYNIVKNHYVKKNNINLEHLDILEKKFGPTIIKYLDNDRFIGVVNLEDDYFNKLFNIINNIKPFDMQDFNGAVISLNERMFNSDYPLLITLFSDICISYDRNEDDSLDNLFTILRLGIDDSITKKITDKYNILNVNNKDELIFFLRKNIGKGVFFDIIHDTCDLYLEKERTRYINDHYFEKKYNFYEPYNNFLEHIKEGNYNLAFIGIYTLVNHLKPNLEVPKEILDKYNLNSMNYIEFFDYIKKKNIDSNDLINIDILFKQLYSDYKENNLDSIGRELEYNLPYKYNKSSLNRIIKNDIFLHSKDYKIKIKGKYIPLYDLILEQVKDEETLDLVMSIMNREKENILDKKTLGKILGISRKIIDDNKDNLQYKDKAYNLYNHITRLNIDGKLSKIKEYYPGESSLNIYEMLSNINASLIKENLLGDDEVYKSFINLLNNKKFFSIPDTLKKRLNEANIDNNYEIISYFLSYYKAIINREKRIANSNKKDFSINSLTIPKILVLSSIFSASSSIYSVILGEENAKLIKSNPGDNRAVHKLEHDQRLKESVNYTVNNYLRETITIPTFDKEFDTYRKKIRVICGNFTDPNILTLGERTSSCMRIGGVGESLYDFCLTNENGFHIVFEDGETNEFVSRVSGFRNGNTIFLNELRNSKVDKFTNDDLANTLRKVGEYLIEISKNSDVPIENVVIHNSFAYDDKYNEVNINIRNIKEGLPFFYSNVDSNVSIVATSSKEKFAKVKVNIPNLPLYKVQEGKLIEYTDEFVEAKERIRRIDAIKQLIKGIQVENIDVKQFDYPLKYALVSDNYYIVIDEKNNIISDYVGESFKEEYKKKLESIKNTYVKPHTK